MKKNYLFLVFLLLTFKVYSQINSFDINCGVTLKVFYQKNLDNSVNFIFNYSAPLSEVLTSDLPSPLDLNSSNNKQMVLSILNNRFFQVHNNNQLNILTYDVPTKKITYELNLSFSKNNFFVNDNQIDLMYDNLKSFFVQYNIQMNCTQPIFKTKILNEIAGIENKILNSSTKSSTSFRNPEIISTGKTSDDDDTWLDKDRRNPVAFTSFLIRNPTVNGISQIIRPSNLSSYHYIRPGSIINILFLEEVYRDLHNVNLSIEAYLKRIDGTLIPININGYFEVNLKTNQNEIEHSKTKEIEGGNFKLNYNYTIKPTSNAPIQTEINPNALNPQVGEKIFITISNVDDNNASFSMVFEFEEYGWTSQTDGGFSWVNTINSGNHDFVAAGSSSYNFYYKLNKGDAFFYKFIMPSFGPELLVLQDSTQKTLVGLGANVSLFMRTFKIGYGWYLNGNNGQPYVSLGVNFVEGYKSISSILNNVKGD